MTTRILGVTGVGRRRQGIIYRRTVLFGPRPGRAAVKYDQGDQAGLHGVT